MLGSQQGGSRLAALLPPSLSFCGAFPLIYLNEDAGRRRAALLAHADVFDLLEAAEQIENLFARYVLDEICDENDERLAEIRDCLMNFFISFVSLKLGKKIK